MNSEKLKALNKIDSELKRADRIITFMEKVWKHGRIFSSRKIKIFFNPSYGEYCESFELKPDEFDALKDYFISKRDKLAEKLSKEDI